MKAGWPIQLELRIDWSELDLFGHVNNVAIMKYFQAARVLYLEKIGLMQSQAETKIGPILASATCQFRKPLHYPGRVVVHCRVDLVKSSSFRIAHRLVDECGRPRRGSPGHHRPVRFQQRHQDRDHRGIERNDHQAGVNRVSVTLPGTVF